MDWQRAVDQLRPALMPLGFEEFRADFASDTGIVAIINKRFTALNGLFGGRGLVAVAVVPERILDAGGLRDFVRGVRRTINREYVSFPFHKSMHSFMVLFCPHSLFSATPGVESSLKDRTGLHFNLVQGVVCIDRQTGDVRRTILPDG